jgi:anti-sigma regulatory factor (Ser/Thr protein kinase)
MLIGADYNSYQYRIAVNSATGSAELMSDLSYLECTPVGVITIDFTHMGVPLTQELREEYLPGSFGYLSVQHLLEVVAAIAVFKDRCSHKLMATLPNQKSRAGQDVAVGKFLNDMDLASLLQEMGVEVRFADPLSQELGRDDRRQNLIPLMRISAPEPHSSERRPDQLPIDFFKQSAKIRERVEGVFSQALFDDPDLASILATVVQEAVDNMVRYGKGGIIGGLYYPYVGEVEVTLVNRRGGFGGKTPDEQLESLLTACEARTDRQQGGNGITELSRLAITCFGTLYFRSGNAALRMSPDGSIIGTTEETGLPTPGASVTILLQLLPNKFAERTETMKAYEAVLRASLEAYINRKGLNNGKH